MKIEAAKVAELRRRTNASMMDCKQALVEAQGDLAKAEEILRKKGQIIVASYIHLGGKVGVLVEVNCETDFVAKNDNFRELVKDITLQIAASNPLYVSRNEVPADVLAKEREIAAAQVKGKPQPVVEKIVEGKLDKYYQTVCLIEQGFVKNPEISVKDLITKKITELGENLVIRRFVRYQVGEEISGGNSSQPPAAESAPAAS
jgi:elongation factor Ts